MTNNLSGTNSTVIIDEFKRISSVMLEKRSLPYELRQASWDLYNICSGITGIHDESQVPEDHTPILLQTGKAISPKDAGKCLQDYARTVMFMRGIYEGILEAQKRFPGEKITILYAGCGPFVPYVLVMSSMFSSNEIDFILIDIHQRAIDAAGKIIQHFDLNDYVKEYVLADAAIYKLPPDTHAHILLIETANSTLSKEPQVAITSNLARQICENGILVPEEIIITACLANPDKEFKIYNKDEAADISDTAAEIRERINPQKIYEVSLKKIPRVKKLTPLKTETLVKPTAVYKAEVPGSGKSLMLCTQIKTFGDNILNDYDSGITLPLQIEKLLTAGNTSYIEFSYWTGKVPGFKYRLISESRYNLKKYLGNLKNFFLKK